MILAIVLGLAGGALALAAWGLFESTWVRLRTAELRVPGLPEQLDGLRIVHLSDFHLGAPSLAFVAVRRAARWARARRPDLVVVTGDLLSRQRGLDELHAALRGLDARLGVVAVLGNHDVSIARDPFSGPTDVGDLRPLGVELLEDASTTRTVRGARLQIAGVSPSSYLDRTADPAGLSDPAAALRILLCHFPRVVDRFDTRPFHLTLAGHVHGGQINLPTPWGPIRLAHLRARYPEGTFGLGSGRTLVVSRGLGTTFVPFRLCCRPEAVELRLRRADA
ncbi:MAG: metallophosphoesterase [Thermoleophilia bacterium]